MWRRWGNSQPSHSAEPTYVPYEEEESYLETIPEVDSRPVSTNVATTLSFQAAPSISQIPPRESVYSQPSPLLAPSHAHARLRDLSINTHAQIQRGSTEISPLSTPGSYQENFSNRESISPIDGAAHPFARDPLPERTTSSQIPKRIISNKTPKQDRKDRTRWDEYSGEPTTDDRGKPGTARPGGEVLEMQYPHLKERTKQILANLRERELAKKQESRMWGKSAVTVQEDSLDNPPQKEPWKGASGRTALVEPVRNTPSARKGPINFPKRNVSRMNTIVIPPPDETQRIENFLPLSAQSAPEMNAEHQMSAFMDGRDVQRDDESEFYTHPYDNNSVTPNRTAASLRTVESEESLRPVPPLKTTTQDRNQDYYGAGALQSPFQSPYTSSTMLEAPQAYFETVRTESPAYEPEPTTPTTPTRLAEPENIDEDPSTPTGLAPAQSDHEVSRFSWTTYATSVADTPRSMAQMTRDSSPPPPMPGVTFPLAIQKRPTVTNPYAHEGPYMHASGAYSTGSVVLRKPVPNKSSAAPMSAAERSASVSKDLPLVPDQLEAADKIAGLEAAIEALNRRKRNITRIISDLEESLKRNNVTYDIFKHREVEKTIASHQKEMDNITQELHDIGIQLHRAQRKRDRDDNYEQPTGLWIKRVTS